MNYPLWRATKDGNTAFITGTAHALSEKLVLPRNLLDGLAKSKVLLTELDFRQPPDAMMAGQIFQMMKAPQGECACDVLGVETAQRLFDIVRDYVPPPLVPHDLRLWALAAMFGEAVMKDVGFTAKLGVERVIYDRWKGPVIGLETPMSQLKCLVKIPDETWARGIERTLEGMDKMRSYFQKFWKAWSSSDFKTAMQYHSLIDPAGTAREHLARERDPLMAQNIVGHMKEHNVVFVAVGALHLLGEGNVLQFLKKNGCRVTRA